MTEETDRLDSLEEFAVVIGTAAGLPWLDQQILGQVARANDDPSRRAALLRCALILGEGRKRLQLISEPPSGQATSAQKASIVTEADIIRRNTLLLDRFEREVNTSKSYTTVITGAGYAGLLALWAGLRDHIGREALLYSAVGVAVSLAVFVSWEMVKSQLIESGVAAFDSVVREKFFSADFEAAYGIARKEQIDKTRAFNTFQPFIFWISTISGFGSATILVCSAIAAATSLKITFG